MKWAALLLALFLATFRPSPVAGQQSRVPHITKFFIAEPAPGSGYDTGPLHIIYPDGTEVVQTLPPLRHSTEKESIFNAVGFTGAALAPDGQTLGWTVNVQNCCTSYSIPLKLVVFRNKRVLHSFDEGTMVWDWMFLDDGKQVAAVVGPTHGTEIGDYRLYDVATGRLLSEVWGDAETQSLKTDAPGWARRLQDHYRNRTTTP